METIQIGNDVLRLTDNTRLCAGRENRQQTTFQWTRVLNRQEVQLRLYRMKQLKAAGLDNKGLLTYYTAKIMPLITYAALSWFTLITQKEVSIRIFTVLYITLQTFTPLL